MYPARELKRLALRKAVLRRNLAEGRVQCAVAATAALAPLAWLDRAAAFWRRLSPLAGLAAVPLGLMAQRLVFPRLKILGSLARWSPLILGAARGIRSVFASKAA